jgi:hypothetical protein
MVTGCMVDSYKKPLLHKTIVNFFIQTHNIEMKATHTEKVRNTSGCRLWNVKNSGFKNSFPTEVKRSFIPRKIFNFHGKMFVEFLSNRKLSTKPAHLHLSFGTFLYWIYVHFIFTLLQSFYIFGLWNFLCQKSWLIWHRQKILNISLKKNWPTQSSKLNWLSTMSQSNFLNRVSQFFFEWGSLEIRLWQSKFLFRCKSSFFPIFFVCVKFVTNFWLWIFRLRIWVFNLKNTN